MGSSAQMRQFTQKQQDQHYEMYVKRVKDEERRDRQTQIHEDKKQNQNDQDLDSISSIKMDKEFIFKMESHQINSKIKQQQSLIEKKEKIIVQNQNLIEILPKIQEKQQKEVKFLKDQQYSNMEALQKVQLVKELKEENEIVAKIAQNTQFKQEIKIEDEIKQGSIQSQFFFDQALSSKTITFSPSKLIATQYFQYYQNKKIALLSPKITSQNATVTFVIEKLKYCIGVGIMIVDVIKQHQFTYQSHANELGHGMYVVTSQGYSWSHHCKAQDDILRAGFNKMITGQHITLTLSSNSLHFKHKQSNQQFQLEIPANIRRKELCFGVYLHQKSDSLRILQGLALKQ